MDDLHIVGRSELHLSWRPVEEGPMHRSGHALVVNSGVWLVDPIDLPGLDEQLESLGPVVGIVQTLGRHTRGSRALAGRHGVDVWADRILGNLKSATRTIDERIPGTPLLSIPLKGRGLRGWWREAAIWWPERRLAVVGESLGNAPYYLLGNESLGLHPMRRGQPPDELGRLDIDRLLCGHGDGLPGNAAPVIREVLEHGPGRRSPAWMLKTLRAYR